VFRFCLEIGNCEGEISAKVPHKRVTPVSRIKGAGSRKPEQIYRSRDSQPLEIKYQTPGALKSTLSGLVREAPIRLSESSQAHASLTAWLNTIDETQRRIIARLETLNEYTYNGEDDDAVVQYANVPEFETIPTGGRPSQDFAALANYRCVSTSKSLLEIHYGYPRNQR
jgi:hypothetical protein